jgi:hypothetical protein
MKKIILLSSLIYLSFACEVDTPVIPNEEELITTVIYTLTPQNGGADVILKFQDIDGDGGNAPVINSANLTAGITYTGKLTFLNEAENPVEDITAEIKSEGEEHQIFYQTSSTLNLTVAYADMDENNKPIGLETTLAANIKTTGTLKITLKHEPNKSAMNVDKGDITNAGGETDIEVSFNVTVN